MHGDCCYVRAADLYYHDLHPHPLQPELAVHTVAKQLLPVHESIIIGSPGFWDLASPAACALRAHFHLRASCHVALSVWVFTVAALPAGLQFTSS